MKIKTELQELRNKNKSALFLELAATQRKITENRLDFAMGKIKNYHKISELRKRASRIWTILAEKMIEEKNEEK